MSMCDELRALRDEMRKNGTDEDCKYDPIARCNSAWADELDAILARTCEWTEDVDGVWETGCGRQWGFVDGGPAENDCHYCHFCGAPIAAEPIVDPTTKAR